MDDRPAIPRPCASSVHPSRSLRHQPAHAETLLSAERVTELASERLSDLRVPALTGSVGEGAPAETGVPARAFPSSAGSSCRAFEFPAELRGSATVPAPLSPADPLQRGDVEPPRPGERLRHPRDRLLVGGVEDLVEHVGRHLPGDAEVLGAAARPGLRTSAAPDLFAVAVHLVLRPALDKDVVGGYGLIDVGSKEEAVEWAKRFPASEDDPIEIRRLRDVDDFPDEVRKIVEGD